MKCEKCGNEYPTPYYFQTQTVCRECFTKMTPEEQQSITPEFLNFATANPLDKRIGFGKRFLASIIDGLIFMLIAWVIQYLTGYSTASKELELALKDAGTDTSLMMQIGAEFFKAQRLNLAISYFIAIGYYSFEIFKGAALGKVLLKIRIMDIDGTKAIVSSLITRFLLKNIILIVLMIMLLINNPYIMLNISMLMVFGLLVIFSFISDLFIFSSRKQTLYDIIAGTAVYTTKATN